MEKVNQKFYLLKGGSKSGKELTEDPSRNTLPIADIVPPQERKQVDRNQLINKLNFINFQNGTILLKFRHVKYNRSITLEVKPMPCSGGRLDCLWAEEEAIVKKINSYQFDTIYLIDGPNLLLVVFITWLMYINYNLFLEPAYSLYYNAVPSMLAGMADGIYNQYILSL